MKKRWKELCAFLRGLRPVTSKQAAKLIFDIQVKHDAHIRSLSQRHTEELTKTTEMAGRLIDRLSRIQFRYDGTGDQYAVTVRFDSRMFGGLPDAHERRYIAGHVAHQVEREIATGHFVQSAHELDREIYNRRG